MNDMFQNYERQFKELQASVSQGYVGAATLADDKKRSKAAELKSIVDEAESLIRKMDLEARGLPAAQKAIFLAKLKDYKAELTNSKREVKKLMLGDARSSRDQLFEGSYGSSSGGMMVTGDHRMKLATSTDRMQQTGDRVKEARRNILETEDLGVSILQDLHQQRQTLLHASQTLHGVDDNIARGKMIIHSISKRITRNKYIMGGLIGFLIFAILLVVMSKKNS